ncbi:hypothetical protein COK19_14325 [Bacillus cereus]|nr:hypothetical protein COK19_14325 [Bacillus cereus]PGZ12987.1 hypothetical protein COE46_21825 [Bacillus cereus]
MLLFHVSFAICNPTFDVEKDVGLGVCIGVFFCYNVRMHKRKFKKSGQDNLRISSLLCQSGTHVVKATLRILLAAAPRSARFSRSSFLNMYSKRKFKKPGQDNCFFEKTYKDD